MLRVQDSCDPDVALVCPAEVSGHLVGSPAFKAGEWGDPPLAGSIPVHLRSHVVDVIGGHALPLMCLSEERARRNHYGDAMKKLLVIAVLIALGVVAARKLRVD